MSRVYRTWDAAASAASQAVLHRADVPARAPAERTLPAVDRKSTRLNSSHGYISYAVFCLKKKQRKLHQSLRCTQHTVHVLVHGQAMLGKLNRWRQHLAQGFGTIGLQQPYIAIDKTRHGT